MKLGALLPYRKLLGNGAGSCFGIFFVKKWWWFFRTTKNLNPSTEIPPFHKKRIKHLPSLVATPPQSRQKSPQIIHPSRPSRKSARGSCGSSWAFAATAVASFRECLSLLHRGFLGVCLLELARGYWYWGGGGYWVMYTMMPMFFWFKVYVYYIYIYILPCVVPGGRMLMLPIHGVF